MPFSSVVDADGITHQLCTQALDETCCCACIAMIVRKIRSTALDEAAARKTLDRLHGFSHSKGGHNWTTQGAMDALVASALSDYKITSAMTWDISNAAVLTSYLSTRCIKSKPGVAFVDWNAGGGHAIVALGPDNANANILFLDPGHNAVVPIPIGNLPTYAAPYGNVGTFKSWMVTTI